MAIYNAIDKYWDVSLGKNGITRLYLSDIITNDDVIRYDIDNTPTAEHLANLDIIINNIYEPLCIKYTTKIKVLPSYYSFNYIKTMSTDGSSLHNFGQAIDLEVTSLGRNLNNRELFDYIRTNIEFNELIWEFGNSTEPKYVHTSYVLDNNKGEVLILKSKGSNYAEYEPLPTLFNGFNG